MCVYSYVHTDIDITEFHSKQVYRNYRFED